MFRASRGNQDLIRWVGKFLVTKKRVLDVGMDLHEPVDETDPMFGPNYQQRTNEMIHAGLQPVPITDALDERNTRSLQRHKERFPPTDNLMALVFAVIADLTENQRERMATTLSVRGYRVQTYTFDSYEKLSLS